MAHQIIIRRIRSPAPGSINNDIDYICRSFGYFSQRDKQDTAGKIFRLLVRDASGEAKGLTSDQIAETLQLTRGAIVYHLNNFITSGLVIREKNRYRLRSASMQRSIEEIRDDVDRMFRHMLKIASDIDEKLGNYYR
jgi:predicted transcriptional regulator